MALKNLNLINKNLKKRYENKVTTNAKKDDDVTAASTVKVNYVDRSEDLLKQMTFIALANKSFLKIN